MAVTLKDYNVALNSKDTKLEQEELGSLAFVQEGRWMKQVQKEIWPEKDLFHENTKEVITKAIGKTCKRSKPTDEIIATVELKILGFAMKVIQELSKWCRREGSVVEAT